MYVLVVISLTESHRNVPAGTETSSSLSTWAANRASTVNGFPFPILVEILTWTVQFFPTTRGKLAWACGGSNVMFVVNGPALKEIFTSPRSASRIQESVVALKEPDVRVSRKWNASYVFPSMVATFTVTSPLAVVTTSEELPTDLTTPAISVSSSDSFSLSTWTCLASSV